jgi:hypothetical protein
VCLFVPIQIKRSLKYKYKLKKLFLNFILINKNKLIMLLNVYFIKIEIKINIIFRNFSYQFYYKIGLAEKIELMSRQLNIIMTGLQSRQADESEIRAGFLQMQTLICAIEERLNGSNSPTRPQLRSSEMSAERAVPPIELHTFPASAHIRRLQYDSTLCPASYADLASRQSTAPVSRLLGQPQRRPSTAAVSRPELDDAARRRLLQSLKANRTTDRMHYVYAKNIRRDQISSI